MPTPDYFKHYEGPEPFIFISYCHADSEEVMRVITDMHSRGFRLWYDEGIEVGAEWQESIACHLVEADMMIAFISNAYMQSDNCRKEMAFALSKKKKVINIFLEETQLTPGMELQLGNIFAVMKYTYPSEGYFYAKLYGSELFRTNSYGCTDTEVNVTKKEEKTAARFKKQKEQKKESEEKKEKLREHIRETKPRRKRAAAWITALAILAVVIAAGVVGYFTGYLQRIMTPTVKAETLSGDTVAKFENPLVEEAARAYTGISQGDITVSDLAGLTGLYIVGDRYWFEEPQSGAPADSSADTCAVTDHSGGVFTANRGDIKSLADFAYFPSLTTLWVEFEDITSLDTLPACLIENFSAAGNRVTSLNGICSLPNLQRLRTDGCPITDAYTLNQCLDMREVSLLGANISDLSPFETLVHLQSAALSNNTLSELQPVLSLKHLTSLSFSDCDLSGAFFTAVVREQSITSMSFDGCTLSSLTNIDDFTALSELTVRSCRGISDWSPLASLPSLKTLNIDEAMKSAMQNAVSSASITVNIVD